MPAYSEKEGKTLLECDANADGVFRFVSRINGRAELVGVPVALAGGAGGHITVTPLGVVTLDNTSLDTPAPGSAALAGKFTFTLGNGTHESPTFTSHVEITAVPGILAGFAAKHWDLLDNGTDGQLNIVLAALPADRGASAADLEYRADKGRWTSLGRAALQDYVVTGLPNGRPVDVEIRTVNADGTGTPSDTKTATPTAASTTTLTVSDTAQLQAAIARAARQPKSDWTIICRDFVTERPVTIAGVAMGGSLTDPNQRFVDTAKSERDIHERYNLSARPALSGGSITIRSATPYATQLNGLVKINSSGPVRLLQLGLHRKAKGVPGKDAQNKVTHSLEIDHSAGRYEPVVWIDDCRLGSYKTAGNRDLDYCTQIENNDSALVIVSDCEFDGFYNAMVTRRSKKTLTIRNRISGRRLNDVWSNIQDHDQTRLRGFRKKQLQSVANICLPARHYPNWAYTHADYFQIGAKSDSRDYEILVYNNRIVNEEGLFASSTYPAGKVTTRGWVIGNFIATENSHAITPGNIMSGNTFIVAYNTCVKYAMSARQADPKYGGAKAEAQIRVSGNTSGKYFVHSNILGRLVGPNGTLATNDRTVPTPPTRWGKSGVIVRAYNNAYVSNFGGAAGYAAAFSGPFKTSADRGPRRAIWRWSETNYQTFAADVDRIFTPRGNGAAAGKGHLAPR